MGSVWTLSFFGVWEGVLSTTNRTTPGNGGCQPIPAMARGYGGTVRHAGHAGHAPQNVWTHSFFAVCQDVFISRFGHKSGRSAHRSAAVRRSDRPPLVASHLKGGDSSDQKGKSATQLRRLLLGDDQR